MTPGAILLAEKDSEVLRNLAPLLSSQLPRTTIDVCASLQETTDKLFRGAYLTVIAAPELLRHEGSLFLHELQRSHRLIPVLLTASQANVEPVREALLCRGAFDVITKPFDPVEALSSVRVAMWQARLLQLLTQRTRVLADFQRHIRTYPKERAVREMIESTIESIEDTLTLVRKSILLIEPTTEGLFFDLAVSIEQRVKARALKRLTRLSAKATNQ